jgi:isoleucyl-tRNA synthetase
MIMKIVEKKKGSQWLGLEYEPLFPYFSERAEQGAFQVYNGDYVSTEDGTGIVHTASGFGEDDYEVLRHTEIEPACPIDGECQFTADVPDYQGRFVKDCDKDIIKRLTEEGKLVKRDQLLHPYPHCWRCESPLIYRAIGSWFVKIDPIKKKMIDSNNTIRWVPDHLQQGRFGKWLEGARDWAISRNRYWGNPIPIWICPDCDKRICVGSREELEKLSGAKVTDLHKHFVDEIEIPCSCGSQMKRVPEVLDCWFESGSMPYAQVHYPFENKEWFEANFPANFIAEGLDQTRGWFYTLTILAAALFDGPAFQNVIVNGMILAEDGKKMSKSLRNYTDPVDVINKFSADAMRLYLMNSPAVKAESLRFSDEGVREVLKGIIIPLWNAYSFFVTYANVDGCTISSAPDSVDNPMDQWMLSETEKLVANATEQLDAYDLQRTIDPIVAFIDSLNNWYIRRSRRRFWKSENDDDKNQAYQTLWHALITLTKVAAPFIPFVTEEIYQNLKTDDMAESVHLAQWPVAADNRRDRELERKMELTRQSVSMGRALRTQHKLKTRQPLKALHLVTRDRAEKTILYEMSEIISEELNVKEVIFRDNEEELVEYSAKANFKVLGRVLGKDMKTAAARIEQLTPSEITSLMEGATLSIEFKGQEHTNLDLTADSIAVQRSEKEGLKVLNEGSLTVALDPEITEELLKEGIVRDIVRAVQNLRKEKDLDVTDRIKLCLNGPDIIQSALDDFEDYLMQETLCNSWSWEMPEEFIEVAAGDEEVKIGLEKV